MDRSDIVTLYSDSITFDNYGVPVKSRTARDVFCKVESVTRAEFFEAGRAGLKPEYRITMFSGDYQDESIAGYKDRIYSIYRTFYGKNDDVELYVERKTGTDITITTGGGDNGTENTG